MQQFSELDGNHDLIDLFTLQDQLFQLPLSLLEFILQFFVILTFIGFSGLDTVDQLELLLAALLLDLEGNAVHGQQVTGSTVFEVDEGLSNKLVFDSVLVVNRNFKHLVTGKLNVQLVGR